jgi:hypothetical protein
MKESYTNRTVVCVDTCPFRKMGKAFVGLTGCSGSLCAITGK